MAKKILFINQEIEPYVPATEVSLMGRIMPHAMQESGFEIRTFMPKWGGINERRGQLHEVIRLSGMNIIIDDTDNPLIIKVASMAQTRLQVYFIDNDDFFTRRTMLRDEEGVFQADNAERAIFFARGVLETVKKLRWTPDIIFCQGLMAGVVPLYVKTAYKDEPSFADVKVATGLFPYQANETLSANFKKLVEFRDAKAKKLAAYKDAFDLEELSKLAIDYSDGVVAMSDKVDPAVAAHAEAAAAKFLPFPGDDYKAQCAKFFEEL